MGELLWGAAMMWLGWRGRYFWDFYRGHYGDKFLIQKGAIHMNRDQAVRNLIRAVREEGRNPAYHREVMHRHRREWPALWKAIDQILVAGEPTKREEG